VNHAYAETRLILGFECLYFLKGMSGMKKGCAMPEKGSLEDECLTG